MHQLFSFLFRFEENQCNVQWRTCSAGRCITVQYVVVYNHNSGSTVWKLASVVRHSKSKIIILCAHICEKMGSNQSLFKAEDMHRRNRLWRYSVLGGRHLNGWQVQSYKVMGHNWSALFNLVLLHTILTVCALPVHTRSAPVLALVHNTISDLVFAEFFKIIFCKIFMYQNAYIVHVDECTLFW